MILTLNEIAKVASVQNWDQEDWDAQKSTIPWDYTIEFDPIVDSATLENISDGREIHYDQRTVYVTEWIDNTMIVRPQIIFVQQLLPLSTAPMG